MNQDSAPPIKVVVSGPVGSGKTTLIRNLSQIPVVDTEVPSSEAIGKANTTVALDFGRITLGATDIHLFGTPGQERFSFMWELLSEGADGLVLMLAADHPEQFGQARSILEAITSVQPVPFIVALTHCDADDQAWVPAEVAAYFDLPPQHVIATDARDRQSACDVLVQLLANDAPSPDPHHGENP